MNFFAYELDRTAWKGASHRWDIAYLRKMKYVPVVKAILCPTTVKLDILNKSPAL